MLRGDEMWCQLFSEPGAGSDLSTLATRAVLDGDECVVNGQKVWTSEAQHADYGILLARTDPDVPKHRGITFFVVDMRTPGIDIRPLVQATGLSHFNEVFLTDVRIPAENVIGEVNGGWAAARTTLASEAGMIGGAGLSSTFVAVLALARECGRTDDPLVRQMLADVYSRERILKFHGMRMQTAMMHKRGIPPDPSVLKNFFVQSLTQRVDLALTLEGTAGMLAGDDAIQDGFWQKQCMAQFSSRIGGGTIRGAQEHDRRAGARPARANRGATRTCPGRTFPSRDDLRRSLRVRHRRRRRGDGGGTCPPVLVGVAIRQRFDSADRVAGYRTGLALSRGRRRSRRYGAVVGGNGGGRRSRDGDRHRHSLPRRHAGERDRPRARHRRRPLAGRLISISSTRVRCCNTCLDASRRSVG